MNESLERDKSLLSGCFADKGEARETLVRQFSNLVYQAVLHTLRAKNVQFFRHDVEDLHNNIFLKLFDSNCRKLRQYKGRNGCSLATWIRLVAVRTVLDHLRKKGVDAIASRSKQIPLDEMLGVEARQANALELIEKAEQERLVRDAAQYLPPRDRLFMKLHFEKDLSVAQVALTMKLTSSAAYTLKHRVIKKLRAHVISRLEEKGGV
jgi:RNA polymerase sigma factor (sigma-70 family)